MAPVKITGQMAGLREMKPDDAVALRAVYGDPKVTEFMSFTPRTLEQCQAIIDAAQADAAAQPRQVWMLAVEDPATGELTGAARLALGEWNSAQIGFALRADRWGHGEGTEIVRLLHRLGFTELSVHRIWGARSPRNFASARTLIAAGMIEEGTLRGHVQRHGTWEDSISHSILAEEYQP